MGVANAAEQRALVAIGQFQRPGQIPRLDRHPGGLGHPQVRRRRLLLPQQRVGQAQHHHLGAEGGGKAGHLPRFVGGQEGVFEAGVVDLVAVAEALDALKEILGDALSG